MTSANTSEDLHHGRGWLNRAAEMLDACEDHVSDAEFATAAAAIGNGFVQLALAELSASSMAETSQVRQAILTMSDEPEPTLGEAIAREMRAVAEARPHDEPVRHPLGHLGWKSCAVCNPQPGDPVPDAEQPRGEAAYLLEGDDEIFTAPTPVIVHVVAEDDGNVLHVASTAGKAEQWLMATAGNREARDALSITELAVDRG